MKLNINQELIDIPQQMEEKLLTQFEEKVLEVVEKLPAAFKMAIKVFAREELKRMEDRMRPVWGVERAKIFRPAKGESPITHLAGFMRAKLEEGLVNAIGTIDFENREVTALNFSVPNQDISRRQVAPDGNVGQWEDHSLEISGRDLYETLSPEPPLYPGYQD